MQPCAERGCPVLVNIGRCIKHSHRQPGVNYGRKWGKARRDFLAEHPFCVFCERQGKMILADVVDHIKPHRGNSALFWSPENWQSLCTPHHSVKSATEDA